jgi:shikimate kinase
MTARHVVLVGLMGSGKTTVGRILARRLGRPFVDSDETIEAREGRTVREIWLADGESAFRALESEVLRDALDGPAPSVIAAAGGVVLADVNRTALTAADAAVVWLAADQPVLLARATSGEHRPLLDEDPAATLRTMAAYREPLYREVADVVIDIGSRAPDEIADEILHRIADDAAGRTSDG